MMKTTCPLCFIREQRCPGEPVENTSVQLESSFCHCWFCPSCWSTRWWWPLTTAWHNGPQTPFLRKRTQRWKTALSVRYVKSLSPFFCDLTSGDLPLSESTPRFVCNTLYSTLGWLYYSKSFWRLMHAWEHSAIKLTIKFCSLLFFCSPTFSSFDWFA